MPDTLEAYLRRAGQASLLLVHPTLADVVPIELATLAVLPGSPVPASDTWDAVTLVVPDRLALRSLTLPELGRSRRVAVWLAGGSAVAVRPRPEWPPLDGLRSRRLRDGSWLLVLRFRAPVAAAAVLAEVGRQSVRGDVAGNAGLWSADRVARRRTRRCPRTSWPRRSSPSRPTRCSAAHPS